MAAGRTRPLNPGLYRTLEHLFGPVRIGAEGEQMQATPSTNLLTGRPKLNIQNAGEYYYVNCPFCTDLRKRLAINYRYGMKDDSGRFLKFLAICYNETACMDDPNNQEELYMRITAIAGDVSRLPVKPGKIVDTQNVVAELPGPCIPLQQLDISHPARQYIESRHFDSERIGRFYRVSYCEQSRFDLARNRIVIPVYDRGTLQGWQTRYIGELPWYDKEKRKGLPPKYWTMPHMQRRRLLYNFDNAKAYKTLVIVEGPMDVWGFGPMATCTFGATVTDLQFRRIVSSFRTRSVCLVFDPEAYESPAVVKAVQLFRQQMKRNFAAVVLPPGTDPGSLDRTFQREYVKVEAQKQGVSVSWEKV